MKKRRFRISRADSARDGSPGVADPDPIYNLFVNEIAAHTDTNLPPYDSDDWIELYNASPSGFVFAAGDWFLSDDPDELKKWTIPPVFIPSGGWVSSKRVSASGK